MWPWKSPKGTVNQGTDSYPIQPSSQPNRDKIDSSGRKQAILLLIYPEMPECRQRKAVNTAWRVLNRRRRGARKKNTWENGKTSCSLMINLHKNVVHPIQRFPPPATHLSLSNCSHQSKKNKVRWKPSQIWALSAEDVGTGVSIRVSPVLGHTKSSRK